MVTFVSCAIGVFPPSLEVGEEDFRLISPAAHVTYTIPVRAFGRDSRGLAFSTVAAASQISSAGALLAHIRVPLSSGHPVTVEYESRRAQFRVVWARDGRIAVHKCEGESCPWTDALPAKPNA